MSSENPFGADNQQETDSCKSLNPMWIVGFVDGEGCFSVSIFRKPAAKAINKWQLYPVFQVYQHMRYRKLLEQLQLFFGCGNVRPKGGNSSVLTFAVESMRDIEDRILPFFDKYELIVKRNDYKAFREIVRAMRRKEHLTLNGFERLVRLAYSMNGVGKQRARKIEEILS